VAERSGDTAFVRTMRTKFLQPLRGRRRRVTTHFGIPAAVHDAGALSENAVLLRHFPVHSPEHNASEQ